MNTLENVVLDVKKIEELNQFIDSIKEKAGCLIGVLHKAQELFGYLPKELQLHISKKLNIPASKVYGVVSFYSFFNMNPKGRHLINVCMGTACYVRGGEKLLQEFEEQLGIKQGETTKDSLFTLASLRCVGTCGLAPVIIIDGVVYGRVQVEDVKNLIEEYKGV